MQSFKDFEEMYAFLRGKLPTIEHPDAVEEEKPKKKATKKTTKKPAKKEGK